MLNYVLACVAVGAMILLLPLRCEPASLSSSIVASSPRTLERSMLLDYVLTAAAFAIVILLLL